MRITGERVKELYRKGIIPTHEVMYCVKKEIITYRLQCREIDCNECMKDWENKC